MGKNSSLIFEKKYNHATPDYFSPPDIPLKSPQSFFAEAMLRKDLPLPSLSEREVVRHYLNLSRKNFGVDSHFYPLGSCTMKYNPKINEDVANQKGFIDIHPYQPYEQVQGALQVLYHFSHLLCALTGMKKFSFQAAAGAQGEFTGILMIKSYFQANNQQRTKVLIPDSGHGTNPASAAMCGYRVGTIPSTKEGLLDVAQLKAMIDEDTAALMLTNPNTLGLFEERILEISEIVHSKGAFLYYDGANFNALLGITKPSLQGFDVIHLNLHKTFATPHGSGGPGAAAVGVNEQLSDFLPVPVIEKHGDEYSMNYDLPHSIGKIKAFYGNFTVIVKAYAYILRLGRKGLKRVAHYAVLNSNYLKEKLKDFYEIASDKQPMHECVVRCMKQKESGCSAYNIAKWLIDFGFHPPTMYFPLIVKEALMIEPTETESKEDLDRFIQAMKHIDEIRRDRGFQGDSAPVTSCVARVDEVMASRSPNIRWKVRPSCTEKNKEKDSSN